MILDRLALPHAHLLAELHLSEDLSYLRLSSPREPDRDLLLPLDERPLSAALARFTRLGRLHALYWCVALGHGDAASGTVEFATTSLRWASSETVDAHRLGEHWWIADVEGAFDTATLRHGTTAVASLPLGDATRC